MDFAVMIVRLANTLRSQREYILSDQIKKSGTSIGANIREASYAHSTPDFIAKLQIALKEANETEYWLDLLLRTEYISLSQYRQLSQICKELRLMLIASVRTAAARLNSSDPKPKST